MAEFIYSKYSNERSRKFAIRTDILEEDGKRFARKSPLYAEGENHVENLLKWQAGLWETYEKAGYHCNRCEKDERGVRLEFVEGGTLEEFLDDLLERGKIQEATEELRKYLKNVQTICSGKTFEMTDAFKGVFGEVSLPAGLACAEMTNIDMVCENLVLTEVPTILDYEWTFDFPVPSVFVLYRIIHYYHDTHSARARLDDEALYKEFGITKELREAFKQMEASFQNYITGGHIPMREMFASMTPGVGRLEVINSGALQVYFAEGEDYTEENSVSYPMEEGAVTCHVKVPQNCRKIRIDPGDYACAVHLKSAAFDGKEADLSNTIVSSGVLSGNWAYIAQDDPHITGITVPKGAKMFTISLRTFQTSQELLSGMAETGMENVRLRAKVQQQSRLIQDMKNTKVWKLYEKYRSKVERNK